MASAAHLDKQAKPKTVVIVSDPAQQRVMHIVLAQQRLKSAKSRHVLMTCQERSGNVEEISRWHETPNGKLAPLPE